MDTLNEFYPLYPPNPDTEHLTPEELELNKNLISRAEFRKRKRPLHFDDFCTIHSDDLWYLWCTITEFTNGSCMLNKLTYAKFCAICFENSS